MMAIVCIVGSGVLLAIRTEVEYSKIYASRKAKKVGVAAKLKMSKKKKKKKIK